MRFFEKSIFKHDTPFGRNINILMKKFLHFIISYVIILKMTICTKNYELKATTYFIRSPDELGQKTTFIKIKINKLIDIKEHPIKKCAPFFQLIY